MLKTSSKRKSRLGFSIAATLTMALVATAAPVAAQPQSDAYRPSREVLLSVGEGELIQLPRNVANVWTSNPGVADVQVNNPRQIGLFGKTNGEATVIATAADGSVVFGAQVRVSQNISSLNDMVRAAMPGSDISVTHVGQIAVINGTVASPDESAQAELLVRALLNPGVDPTSTAALRILPVNRLRTATPQQVMLKVTIAEVSRSLVREINTNVTSRDQDGNGFLFGIDRGTAGTITPILGGNINPATGLPAQVGTLFTRQVAGAGTTLSAAGRLLGVDLLGTLNANEDNGLVNIMAEPMLTALSGETASFLAGGEFPIPISQALGSVTIEYKQYGVGLAFSPTVLENGRISMRVRPEVSELSAQGSIRLNGFEVPALTTRRTETTVELGSGQSMMISGLLRNVTGNTINRTPFLGNLPIIGALFRSNGFRRAETELVIVITPYLVQPVSANRIALPNEGFRAANDGQQLLLGRVHGSRSGERRPAPTAGPPQVVTPGVTVGQAVAPAVPAPAPASARQAQVQPAPRTATAEASARPGFEF